MLLAGYTSLHQMWNVAVSSRTGLPLRAASHTATCHDQVLPPYRYRLLVLCTRPGARRTVGHATRRHVYSYAMTTLIPITRTWYLGSPG